jgi:hypothetical protein
MFRSTSLDPHGDSVDLERLAQSRVLTPTGSSGAVLQKVGNVRITMKTGENRCMTQKSRWD